MDIMHKIESNLWDVLKDYADGFKSPAEVETVKHAISSIFKIRCLDEMDNFSNRGYSRDGRSRIYYDEGSFRGGRSMDRGSYRDGRNGGSYRYSRDSDMREKLEELMQDATDERQRQVIQEMMSRI